MENEQKDDQLCGLKGCQWRVETIKTLSVPELRQYHRIAKRIQIINCRDGSKEERR
jgi:hypothetical protein